jgi:hypothetical protein
MRGATPPLSNTPSWRGAQLKAQGQLYLTLGKLLMTPNFREEGRRN